MRSCLVVHQYKHHDRRLCMRLAWAYMGSQPQHSLASEPILRRGDAHLLEQGICALRPYHQKQKPRYLDVSQ